MREEKPSRAPYRYHRVFCDRPNVVHNPYVGLLQPPPVSSPTYEQEKLRRGFTSTIGASGMPSFQSYAIDAVTRVGLTSFRDFGSGAYANSGPASSFSIYPRSTKSNAFVGIIRHAPATTFGLKDIWDRPTTKTLLSQIDIGNQRSFSSRHCNLKDLSRLPTVTVTLESGVNAIDAKSALEGMNTAPAMEKTTSEEEATTATTTITGSSRCAICLAPFKPGISYEVRTLANCDHRCFHRNCLDRWLLGISSDQRTITNCCPVCKAPALAPDASTTSSAVDEFVSPQYPPTYSSASSKIASGSLKSKLHITPALANDADTRQQNEGTDVASAEPVAGEGNQSNNSASGIERNSDEQAFEYVSSEDDTCIDDDWVWSSCSSNSSNDSRASGAMESERCLNDSIAKPMTSINLATSILPDIPGLVSPRSENDAIEDFSTMNSGTMDASVGEAQLVLSALSLVGDEEQLVMPLSKNSAHQSCGAVTIESENILCPISQEIRCREQSKVTVDDAQNDTLTEQCEDDAHIISVSDIPSWSFVEAGTSLQMIDKPHG